MTLLTIGLLATCVKPMYIDQVKAVNATWGSPSNLSKYPNVSLYYLGGYLPCPFPIKNYLNLPGVGEDYASAFHKQFRGLQTLLQLSPSQFYLIGGTDNYFNIPKLLKLLSFSSFCLSSLASSLASSLSEEKEEKAKDKKEEKDLFLGNYVCGENSCRKIGENFIYFLSGGAGILLSRTTVEKIVAMTDTIVNDWPIICYASKNDNLIPACDVTLAYYLHRMGILPTIDKRFYSHNYQGLDYGRVAMPLTIDAMDLITCHYMTPEDMYTYHSLIHDHENLSGWTWIVTWENKMILSLPLNLILMVDDEKVLDLWNFRKSKGLLDKTYFFPNNKSIYDIIKLNPFLSSHFAFLSSFDPRLINRDWFENVMKVNRNKLSYGFNLYSPEGNHDIKSDFYTGRIDYFRKLEPLKSEKLGTVYQSHPDWFEFYYGDHLNNYCQIHENISSIYHNLINVTMTHCKYLLCLDICEKVISSYRNRGFHTDEITMIQIFDAYFIAAWWTSQHHLCKIAINYMMELSIIPTKEIIYHTDYLRLAIPQNWTVINNLSEATDLVKHHYLLYIDGPISKASYILANPCIRPQNMRLD